jgi:hypothetical protein
MRKSSFKQQPQQKKESCTMKKIIFASILTVVAAVILTTILVQATYGNMVHYAQGSRLGLFFLLIAWTIALWIQIPEWIQQAKDWTKRPRWRR